MMANSYSAQDRSVTINGDIVFYDGVTGHVEDIALLVVLEALGTQRDTLIEGDMRANNASLANHDARTVVNGKIFADLCSRMNIDTRQ